jgi:ATP-dependent Zn protease
MNFENLCYDSDDDCGYGFYCNLENDYSHYHIKNYKQNKLYIKIHNYDKPSIFPTEYYLDTSKDKIEIEMKDDDDEDKFAKKKNSIFIRIFGQLCIFSIFISTVVMIMKMR